MENSNFQNDEESNNKDGEFNIEELFIENKEFEKKLLKKIDLSNIEDLGLVGSQFNWYLSIFFMTSPSSGVIPFIILMWEIIMTLMAFVKNFSELMSASGLFPGAVYYITTRSETNSLIAILFMGNNFAGSFSGLLAYGIQSHFLFFDYPERTKWLSNEERKYAIGRLKNDAGKAHTTHFDKKQIYAALTDWVLHLAILHIGIRSIAIYSFSLFIPAIVNGMGFYFVKSQLLSVPPFFCAGIATLIVAILSDRKRIRIPGKYVGASIVGSGLSPIVNENITGHAKRGILASGMVLVSGNIGGAVSSQIYRQKDFPEYFFGHSMSLGFLIATICITLIQYFVFKTLNKKKKENPQSFLEGKTEEEIKNMGDLHPDFIYSL
ncbi:major facilitator superfamily domain-containing protein [Rhizophagus diaphanus]|nr:major facilitator superfamily domain-containing protein [Rhizophagus diaphanus] [Rhizophagus sp. MUCL 43196]